MNDTLKTFCDWLATTITLATLLSWLPHMAAALGVVWGCYRIYESHLNVKLLKKQLKD
jgi:hypothetical protein